MLDDQYLVVASIGAPHGIKGWVKVHSHTQPEDNIVQYPQLFVQRNGQWQIVKSEAIRQQGKGLVMKFLHCDDRAQADSYKHALLAVKKDSLPVLAEDDYYWHQLQDLLVYSQEKQQLLGKISHLMETGANDVLVIKPCSGSMDQRERLIPYRPEVVKQVDLEQALMIVDWPIDF